MAGPHTNPAMWRFTTPLVVIGALLVGVVAAVGMRWVAVVLGVIFLAGYVAAIWRFYRYARRARHLH